MADLLTLQPLLAAHWPAVQATFTTEAPARDAWDASHLPHCRLVATAAGQVLG